MYENAPTPVPVTQGTVPRVFDPFSLSPAPTVTQCPPPRPDLREPSPLSLRYGLTLPSAAATPSVAQESAEIMCDIHGVGAEMVEPALDLVYELAAHACRFTAAGQVIHLALRCTGSAFEVTVHDAHAAHAHRHLAAVCDWRRATSLVDVRKLVEHHKGGWGYGAAAPYAAGTCTWGTIPYAREAA
ncbi:ATP-binding protein [Streptomyces sp. MS19]|uniref:ATP-binding protein n=1 Tax=Streptomyces sp. MS19 TaxID=3385972 RepID=UPI0039A2FDE7